MPFFPDGFFEVCCRTYFRRSGDSDEKEKSERILSIKQRKGPLLERGKIEDEGVLAGVCADQVKDKDMPVG